jgi:SlyX protein
MIPQENAMDDILERIVELEIRYTHQGQMIEELNAELTASNLRIGQLERELSRLQHLLQNVIAETKEAPDA